MIKLRGTATETLLVWLAGFAFFMSGLANNLSASHDSINYLHHISTGQHLFHQHHLLYHFFAHLWLSFWSPLFSSISEYYIVESFTAIWGSAILALCFAFFRNRFHLTRALSIAGICTIAFSYGIWFYSINVEVYTPAIFFVLGSLYIMSSKQPASSDVLPVALSHALAMLFHQANVLFTIVVIIYIWKNFGNRRAFSLINYFVVAGTLTACTYFFIGWFVESKNDVESFTSWILGYTVGHDYWQAPGWQTPFRAGAGFARSFIGGHFLFQLQPIAAMLESFFEGHGLADEQYLTRNLSPAVAWFLAFLSLLACAAILVLLIRFIRSIRRMGTHKNVVQPLIVTLLVYSIFFCFWMPEILEFWILQMVLVWLLLVGMLPLVRFPMRLDNSKTMAAIAAMVLVINYFGSIKWLRSFDNDWYYQEIQKITATDSDLIIIKDKWILKDYARYFTDARVLAKDEASYSEKLVDEEMKKVLASGGKVFVHDISEAGQDGGAGSWNVIQSY